MKGYLISVFVLIVGLVGCHKDEARPNISTLYRTWQLIQRQGATSQPVAVSPGDPSSIVTFRINGTILYGADGMYYACCSPDRFTRKGDTLDLVDVASVPFPEHTPNELCNRIDCTPVDTSWQLITLIADQLVIKSATGTATYRPYP